MSNRRVQQAKQEARVQVRGQSIYRGVRADDINDELTKIYRRDGGIRASTVVDDARPDDSVLHPIFEWDDKKAAEEFRLGQARTLIREVDVIYEDNTPVQKYIHVGAASSGAFASSDEGVAIHEGAYHPREVVAQNEDMFAAAVSELRQRIAAAQRTVNDLTMAAADFRGTRKKLEKMVEPLQTALKNAEQAAQALAD